MTTEYSLHYTDKESGKEYYFIPLPFEDLEELFDDVKNRGFVDVYIVEREVGEWIKTGDC